MVNHTTNVLGRKSGDLKNDKTHINPQTSTIFSFFTVTMSLFHNFI